MPKFSRKAPVIIYGVVLWIVLLVITKDPLKELPVLEYWIQTIAGNWSPPRPKDLGGFQYTLIATVAVCLNIATVTSVVYSAWKILTERERVMDVATAFILKDIRVKNEIFNRIIKSMELSESKKLELSQAVDECFQVASKKWAERSLPRIMGDKDAEEFIRTYYEPAHPEGNREAKPSDEPGF